MYWGNKGKAKEVARPTADEILQKGAYHGYEILKAGKEKWKRYIEATNNFSWRKLLEVLDVDQVKREHR